MEITNPRDRVRKHISRLFVSPRTGLARRMGLLGLAGVFLCILVGASAMAQTGTSLMSGGHKVATTVPHLYWHFLAYQNHMDQLAAQREQQGKDGSYLRNHFQQKLGFTDAQFAMVRSAAQKLQTDLQGVDAQAKAIIDADRAVNPIPAGTLATWRPVPTELKALQQQHGDVIQSDVASLKSTLGPDLAARLDVFLQNQVAANATVPASHPSPAQSDIQQHLYQAIQKAEEAQQ